MVDDKKLTIQDIKKELEYTKEILEITVNERDRYILLRLISEQKEYLLQLESSNISA